MATYDPRMLAIGVLGKPHGVRGEIGLRLFNIEGSALEGAAPLRPGPAILARGTARITRVVTATRPFGEGLLITIQGVDSREAASALTHYQVLVERASLPPPRPGEYFVSDVIGCDVFNHDGTRLGAVRETFWNGAHDVMIVVGEIAVAEGVEAAVEADKEEATAVVEEAPAVAEGAKAVAAVPEHLIPLVPEFVRMVDVAARTIRVEWNGL